MWESNAFECLVEESPSKNRDARSKSLVNQKEYAKEGGKGIDHIKN